MLIIFYLVHLCDDNMHTFFEMLELVQNFEVLVRYASVRLDAKKDHVDPYSVAEILGYHTPPFLLELNRNFGATIAWGVDKHALLFPIVVMARQVEI